MQTTIKTRNHGDIHFAASDRGGYVRVYGGVFAGEPKQICEGGAFRGVTIIADSQFHLDRLARKWWSQYRAYLNEVAY